MSPITASHAYEVLKAAGFPRTFVEKLLPEWWDNKLLKTSPGALQFALILKQKLGLEVQFGINGDLEIALGAAARASFKHRRDTQTEDLQISATLGIALGRLAIHAASKPYKPLPADPEKLHSQILSRSGKKFVDLAGILDICWSHGIPVLFLKDTPRQAKRMTGMAVMLKERPAIILGFNHTHQARQLFVLAHELGHILCGHLGEDGMLIDEDISEVSERLEGSSNMQKDEEEKEADSFALALIRNQIQDPISLLGRHSSAATLAAAAMATGHSLGIDPGHLILSYAKTYDDWARSLNAFGFYPDAAGALQLIEQKFITNAQLDELSDENREYLLTAQGFRD